MAQSNPSYSAERERSPEPHQGYMQNELQVVQNMALILTRYIVDKYFSLFYGNPEENGYTREQISKTSDHSNDEIEGKLKKNSISIRSSKFLNLD